MTRDERLVDLLVGWNEAKAARRRLARASELVREWEGKAVRPDPSPAFVEGRAKARAALGLLKKRLAELDPDARPKEGK